MMADIRKNPKWSNEQNEGVGWFYEKKRRKNDQMKNHLNKKIPKMNISSNKKRKWIDYIRAIDITSRQEDVNKVANSPASSSWTSWTTKIRSRPFSRTRYFSLSEEISDSSRSQFTLTSFRFTWHRSWAYDWPLFVSRSGENCELFSCVVELATLGLWIDILEARRAR